MTEGHESLLFFKGFYNSSLFERLTTFLGLLTDEKNLPYKLNLCQTISFLLLF